MLSSEMLRPQGSKGLLKNFQDFLSLKKTPEDLQQNLYDFFLRTVFLKRPLFDGSITLVRKGLIPFHNRKTTVLHLNILLPCVLASGVPVKDIKTINVKMGTIGESLFSPPIGESYWEALNILTRGGAVIEEIHVEDGYVADYSPVIQEMIKGGKLLKLR